MLRLLPAVPAALLLLLSEQTAAVLPATRMLLVPVLVDASSPAEMAWSPRWSGASQAFLVISSDRGGAGEVTALTREVRSASVRGVVTGLLRLAAAEWGSAPRRRLHLSLERSTDKQGEASAISTAHLDWQDVYGAERNKYHAD